MSWVLVLEQPTLAGSAASLGAEGPAPLRRVAGLPVALRLALDAQAGGASAVVLAPGAGVTAQDLGDPRLRLPVVSESPPGARRVRVPASFVVYRGLFRKIAEADAASPNPPAERDLRAETFPHGARWGFDPIDVRDAASERAAERALFRGLRKPEDGWTSRYLNRYISLTLSRLLVKTPFTPNTISVGILGVGLAGAWLASTGTQLGFALGAALFQAQSVLDGCDGEMSRVTYRGSLAGEWLDTVGDDVTNYSFFAGAAIGLYRAQGSLLYLAAGATVVLCGLLASGLEYRYLIRIGSGDLLKYPLSQHRSEGFASQIAPLFKRDTFVLLTLLAALAGWLGPMLILFALAAVGILVGVLKTELRLRQQDAS
jgi:phosphatidylglycerophosphate synthase